jgi:hypothetical protein
MSLKMAHKVILPPKKNYIPQFLKQRDINSYYKLPPVCMQYKRKTVIWVIITGTVFSSLKQGKESTLQF